ncbi:MAG: hypothetical protein IJA30_01525 [Bacilli bacterium]|nr:hypothetical protein [Bacilli bacterium]
MKRSVFKIILMLVLFLGISCNVNAAEKNWTVSSGITESEEVKGATYVVFSGKGEVNITKSAATYIKIAKDAEIILNLNGYTISTSDWTDVLVIENMGKLTINGSGTVVNKANNGDWSAAVIGNHPGATLILNGGTYTRSKNGKTTGNSGYIIKNLGSVVVNEGVNLNNGDTTKGSSLIASGWDISNSANNLGYSYDESVKTNLVINGGTFVGGKRSVTSDTGDNTVINGGTFSEGATGILKAAGNVQINGGTFKAVTGKNVLEVENDGKINVTNGDFNQDVSNYMSNDSESIKNEDGTYTVNFVYADYSKIDKIIEKVIDEGVDTYTKESITALEKELEKVDWELGKSKQAEVDKMVEAVTKAFNQLKKIENPKTGNSAVTYILSAIIMVLGIGGCIIYRKKLFN